jgi:hypothetical protein
MRLPVVVCFFALGRIRKEPAAPRGRRLPFEPRLLRVPAPLFVNLPFLLADPDRDKEIFP